MIGVRGYIIVVVLCCAIWAAFKLYNRKSNPFKNLWFWLTILLLFAGLKTFEYFIWKSLGHVYNVEQKIAEGNHQDSIARNVQGVNNSIHIISLYKHENVWVLDDPGADLKREPFIEGIPEIIDSLVWDISNAEHGFTLYFSDQPMPNYELSLTWKREQYYGNWYEADGFDLEGWLCPALFEYYKGAPE